MTLSETINMPQHIRAVQSEADRDRALQRVEDLSGCSEQSPEEVELILITLSLELWELRQRTAEIETGGSAAYSPTCRNALLGR
jgi:hypothetical protein